MAEMGRKGKYESHVKPRLAEITEWCREMNERQIADRLGIGKTAFYKYKQQHEELREALEAGDRQLVKDLHVALRKRAKGYDWEEVQTTTVIVGNKKTVTQRVTNKHVPPDLGSIHLLLKNLDPDWRNDDATTLELKRKELELKEKKIDNNDWN